MNELPQKSNSRLDSAFNLKDQIGLSENEASRRLETFGANELPTEKNRGILRIAFEVLKEPMFLMLVAAGSLYLVMGDVGDALMLLGFVLVIMAITIIQERRTERALDALRDLSSPRALVIRNGVHRRIAGREVVPGDLVIVSEGDRVPADGLLRSALNVSVDESLLTGESVPVRKQAATAIQALQKPGGDDLSSVFSGTLLTAGQGVVEILATGLRSELGQIGKVLQQVEAEPTRLQQETSKIVRNFAVIGMLICGVMVISFALVRGGGSEMWKQGLLAGIALAMATLPEEFPVVLTVFLALGAWRISKKKVLTRRMTAIESLGAATVLCVDKTGTLTQNQMALRMLAFWGNSVDLKTFAGELSESLRDLLYNAMLASKPDPFDPMEIALHDAWSRFCQNIKVGKGTEEPDLIREYPLTSKLLAVSHAWQTKSSKEILLVSKGAPEAIAKLCRFEPDRRARLLQEVSQLASQGLRVLGVARAQVDHKALPEDSQALEVEIEFEFVGIVGLEDPLRSTVPAAIEECRMAGVRVVMITGDYPATAQSIARQAGISGWENLISGSELDRMSDEELAPKIEDTEVFARVVPNQKLRIVEALKKAGEIVAMTGDGVNDAPALKSAHIGIAMGNRGTDVARESASLVLLDDDFSSIVAAIRLGRRIFDNIKKAIAFILAVHVPIIGLSMVPVFFADWPLILLPVHIVFLELVIDPSCTLIFEADEADEDIMQRPPRSPHERLFSKRTVGISVLQGLSVFVASMGVFLTARMNHNPEAARALTFGTLVVAFLMVILVNRSWTKSAIAMLSVPNLALRWVVLGTITLLAIILLVPFAQPLFHFAPLPYNDLLLSLGAGLGCVLWFELLKKRVRLVP